MNISWIKKGDQKFGEVYLALNTLNNNKVENFQKLKLIILNNKKGFNKGRNKKLY